MLEDEIKQPIKTMNFQHLCLLLMLSALYVPAFGQPAVEAARPLNLSLPRELKRSDFMPSGMAALYDPITRNAPAEHGQVARNRDFLPYGSGFEARQRGADSGHRSFDGGGGKGSGMGSAGADRGRMAHGR